MESAAMSGISNPSPRSLSRDSGITLIELMLAMTIGLFLTGGLFAVLLGSTSTYRIQFDHARINENSRFAMQFLSRDIRMAGYFGCVNEHSNVYNGLNIELDPGSMYDISHPLEGLDPVTEVWMPSGKAASLSGIVPGTDAITVRFADPTAVTRVVAHPVPDAPLIVANASHGLNEGALVVVSDCDKADVFRVTGVSGERLIHQPGIRYKGAPGNLSASLGRDTGNTYDQSATVRRYHSARYFVRYRDPSRPGSNAPVALYRQYISGTGTDPVEELVEGVENMQILYGVDTNADGAAISYVTAPEVGTWRNVVSVKIALLIRSHAQYGSEREGSGGEDYTYQLLDETVSVHEPDTTDEAPRFRRHVYSTAIALRNRL
jgi:type IV pilus assembly protein PilW